MKLESLNKKEGGKSKSPPTNKAHADALKDVLPSENFVTFNQGDRVILKSTKVNYSADLIHIAGIELEVDRCFERDLGEGIVAEILYLKGHPGISNPYLAEHFKKVEQ